MSSNDSLYDKALKITQSNEALYDRWEDAIAANLAQKWSDAFSRVAEISGSENPTVMEVADMGEAKISNHEEFLSDLREVFRVLAKGCTLSRDGNWQ